MLSVRAILLQLTISGVKDFAFLQGRWGIFKIENQLNDFIVIILSLGIFYRAIYTMVELLKCCYI